MKYPAEADRMMGMVDRGLALPTLPSYGNELLNLLCSDQRERVGERAERLIAETPELKERFIRWTLLNKPHRFAVDRRRFVNC